MKLTDAITITEAEAVAIKDLTGFDLNTIAFERELPEEGVVAVLKLAKTVKDVLPSLKRVWHNYKTLDMEAKLSVNGTEV